MTSVERIGLSYVISEGPNTSSEIVDSAKLAEKNGFYSVFVPEHYYDRESPSLLGAIVQSTSTIKVGTGVVNPYTRYPSLIAMTIATIDEMSGGRSVLGLGSGGVIGSLEHGIPNEFQGQQFEHPLGHLKETVEIVRRLLSGESVTFKGKFYDLHDVRLHFKPVQSRVPIYFGQQGPKMMELAGEVADGVLITLCCTVPYVKDVVNRVDSSVVKHNRSKGSVDFAARIITSLDDDRGIAIKKAKQLVGRVFIHPGAKPVMDATGFKLPIQEMKKAIETGRSELLYELVTDDVVRVTTASGTKSDILRRIDEFQSAGVTHPLIVPIGRNFTGTIKEIGSSLYS